MPVIRGGLRVLAWGSLAVVAAGLAGAGMLLLPVAGDPGERIRQRAGVLQQVRVERRWREGDSSYRDLFLSSSSGLTVSLTVRRPAAARGRLPAVLILGGLRTGRRAAQLVAGEPPLVVAALSYPYHGPARLQGLDLIRHVPTVQRAVLDTPPAVLLALDYLHALPGVDPARVELVGVSLGAFFVAPAAALDRRVRRVWLIQGAGDPAAVLDHQLRDDVPRPWLRRGLVRFLLLVTDGAELAPERWLPGIAPRPVMVVNSRGDTAFPPEAVRALHAAVRPPGEILWLEGEHITPARTRVIEALSGTVISRIVAGGVPPR